MKHYDYILVGGGLFNGVVAREAGKQGKSCLVVEKETPWEEISCAEMWKESWSMSMEHTFSTRAMRKYGSM
ncbi:hypothetical protein ANACAC_00327 [Anaerostipes caccae L1-92]|uniref:Uncharacterized protein n=1 Tax=Anaerostipes caccae (strain DSM 14662 / CCUG 47493 / JCM 13470 / NCIMB 13811 / L1-92) TaxID=411490 RepID=B0M9V4_ANACD|nr:hypothetical protein [Anaerostipes caccae]EDR99076.1 hypothetical protein ANACAC_00327 [Anaerostipes caccae L1-92]